MSTFRLYFRALFGTFFLKFSYNKILMGKKILVPHYYIQTRHKDLFLPLESHSKKTFLRNRVIGQGSFSNVDGDGNENSKKAE